MLLERLRDGILHVEVWAEQSSDSAVEAAAEGTLRLADQPGAGAGAAGGGGGGGAAERSGLRPNPRSQTGLEQFGPRKQKTACVPAAVSERQRLFRVGLMTPRRTQYSSAYAPRFHWKDTRSERHSFRKDRRKSSERDTFLGTVDWKNGSEPFPSDQ